MSTGVAHDIRADDGRRRALVLERDLRAASAARAWLRELLGTRPPGRQIDEALLVVTELVTNAVHHGLGQITVHAAPNDGEGLALVVTDAADELPAIRAVADGGYGLRIVEQIADRWGVAAFPGGKAVWVELFGSSA